MEVGLQQGRLLPEELDLPMSARERWIGFLVWCRCFLKRTKLIFSLRSGDSMPSSTCLSMMSSGQKWIQKHTLHSENQTEAWTQIRWNCRLGLARILSGSHLCFFAAWKIQSVWPGSFYQSLLGVWPSAWTEAGVEASAFKHLFSFATSGHWLLFRYDSVSAPILVYLSLVAF